eukprot:scaffold347_cov239-Pinguiococcus_pyrenoidosus.AAC.44
MRKTWAPRGTHVAHEVVLHQSIRTWQHFYSESFIYSKEALPQNKLSFLRQLLRRPRRPCRHRRRRRRRGRHRRRRQSETAEVSSQTPAPPLAYSTRKILSNCGRLRHARKNPASALLLGGDVLLDEARKIEGMEGRQGSSWLVEQKAAVSWPKEPGKRRTEGLHALATNRRRPASTVLQESRCPQTSS